MVTPQPDQRSPQRRTLDEQIAAEPQIPHPNVPLDALPSPLEDHLRQGHRQTLAVEGVVENGLIRLLDPAVKLPEHTRVIIVAAGGA